jgi:hypothetical protein
MLAFSWLTRQSDIVVENNHRLIGGRGGIQIGIRDKSRVLNHEYKNSVTEQSNGAIDISSAFYR